MMFYYEGPCVVGSVYCILVVLYTRLYVVYVVPEKTKSSNRKLLTDSIRIKVNLN
jgi:hypothetical protein